MSTATVNLVEIAAVWRSARRIYPIYLALNQQCAFGLQPCRELESPIDRSDPESLQLVQGWLEKMDSLIEVHQLRQLLQTSHIAGEEGLRALLQRQLAKATKDNSIRDKVDYLLVQYYAHCAPHDAHNSDIDHDHVAQVLAPVLGEVSPLIPDFCRELDKILLELNQCTSLGDLLNKKIIDRARTMKDQAGAEYFKPSVLVAYARFNFLLRRGFFRLMHADLHAIRFAIHGMEERGQHFCDCTAAGLAKQQSFSELRQICHEWKQPFRAAYSLGQTFAQLVSIRTAVESALSKPIPAPEPPAAAQKASPAPAAAAAPPVAQPKPFVETVSTPKPSAVDQCIAQVQEALSKMTTKSASVSNFTIGNTKLILASWEVMAFIKPSLPAAQALQRAVASRSLLLQAVEGRKRGETVDLAAASALAHNEAAHLQEEIALAKERKDIDTAVNLAATSKRLLALVEQTEKGK
jgi:hypothetical protein